jgi:two-component system sporulation sensor kinase B
MPIIKEILLQLLFITVPILLYQSIWLERHASRWPKLDVYLVTVVSSVSVLLCMTFPIQTDGGLRYDLRSIPLMLSILYGGFGPGIITAAVTFLYRFYLGGEGFFVTLFGYVLYAVLPFLLVKRWHSFSIVKKMGLGMIMGGVKQLSTAIAIICVSLAQEQTLEMAFNRLDAIVLVGSVHICVMVVVIYLTEYVRETTYIRGQVLRSEKLSMISELAASVAHEVRNPLTVVRGFVQLLREHSNEKNQEYIRLVLAELDRAEYIITDYLSMAKPQVETISTLNMGEIASDVSVSMSSFAVMNGVEIHSFAEDGLLIRGDAIKLKQALMNLMKNSIEAMTAGGVLEIRTNRRGRNVVITVRDQGQGMSPMQLGQLGQPFFSTKEKGTGLGLLVSFRIVESMGGTLVFDSEIGKGTVAAITLPAAPAGKQKLTEQA